MDGKYSHQKHNISPVWDENSRILILGSFPSVKSREADFFYGHPRNRFWQVLAAVLSEKIPESVDEKKRFLLSHGIALWDVIASCDIVGSSDSSIKNVVPNDIEKLLSGSQIKHIFLNGGTAQRLYDKYIFPNINVFAVKLPSTSPANAAWPFEKLCYAWKIIAEVHNNLK